MRRGEEGEGDKKLETPRLLLVSLRGGGEGITRRGRIKQCNVLCTIINCSQLSTVWFNAVSATVWFNAVSGRLEGQEVGDIAASAFLVPCPATPWSTHMILRQFIHWLFGAVFRKVIWETYKNWFVPCVQSDTTRTWDYCNSCSM